VTSHVTSADGTRIAFDRLGEGPSVVLVGGMFCDRQTTRELADRLAHRFSVVNYDRRPVVTAFLDQGRNDGTG
jgi:hypothetical protein